jgi:hypothetical protein
MNANIKNLLRNVKNKYINLNGGPLGNLQMRRAVRIYVIDNIYQWESAKPQEHLLA